MPTLDHIAELFKKQLADPINPEATIALTKEADLTAQYLDALIASGAVNALGVMDKIQLFTMLPMWCPKDAPRLLQKWITVEPDGKLQRVLRMWLDKIQGGLLRE